MEAVTLLRKAFSQIINNFNRKNETALSKLTGGLGYYFNKQLPTR